MEWGVTEGQQNRIDPTDNYCNEAMIISQYHSSTTNYQMSQQLLITQTVAACLLAHLIANEMHLRQRSSRYSHKREHGQIERSVVIK